MSILGDRIMARNVRGKDEKRHVVGRYMQVSTIFLILSLSPFFLTPFLPKLQTLLPRILKDDFASQNARFAVFYGTIL